MARINPVHNDIAPACLPHVALGGHVLRRELQLFRRPTLLALIVTHDLPT